MKFGFLTAQSQIASTSCSSKKYVGESGSRPPVPTPSSGSRTGVFSMFKNLLFVIASHWFSLLISSVTSTRSGLFSTRNDYATNDDTDATTVMDSEDEQPKRKRQRTKRKSTKRKSKNRRRKSTASKPAQLNHSLGYFECPCWRTLQDGLWISYDRPAYDHHGPLPKDYPANPNLKLDSWLDAYRREIGFPEEDEQEADDVENIPSINASYARTRNATSQKKSKDQ